MFAQPANNRLYLLVTFSTKPDEKVIGNFDPYQDQPQIPGFIRPDYFISGVKLIERPQDYADAGENWQMMRTGWDNIEAKGHKAAEEQLYGRHVQELEQEVFEGLQTYCKDKEHHLDLYSTREFPAELLEKKLNLDY